MNHVLGYSGAMSPNKSIPFPKVPLALALLYHLRLANRSPAFVAAAINEAAATIAKARR